jgi:hypothetical protein
LFKVGFGISDLVIGEKMIKAEKSLKKFLHTSCLKTAGEFSIHAEESE